MQTLVDEYFENFNLIAIGLRQIDDKIEEEINDLMQENYKIIQKLSNKQLSLMFKRDFMKKKEILATYSTKTTEIIPKLNQSTENEIDQKLLFNILDLEKLNSQMKSELNR